VPYLRQPSHHQHHLPDQRGRRQQRRRVGRRRDQPRVAANRLRRPRVHRSPRPVTRRLQHRLLQRRPTLRLRLPGRPEHGHPRRLQRHVFVWSPIRENLLFTLRLDAFNATNSVLFPGPNTNPGAGPATYSATSGWSGFGAVPEIQQNFPRVLQVSGKVSF
jgi:hypothetical protein